MSNELLPVNPETKVRPGEVILEYPSPMSTLGDIALRFVMGHGLLGELGHAPMDTTTLPFTSSSAMEALIDTVYSADLLKVEQRPQALRR